ncbi:glyoxalase [Rhodobacterales bacterium HKCCE3408]|nr:glyoxalase [Rhodobacterales bacterium HKCCE3408]
MDYDSVPAPDFGRSLSGFGINLLSSDVRALAGFLADILGLTVRRLSDDFAIALNGNAVMQIHSDAAYGQHPILGIVPENPPRGGGAQIYVFGVDPDAAVARAEAAGHPVIEPCRDKPHGLREATILSPDGYAFSPARSSA